MLTLTRKAGQKIRIGDDIEIVVREIRGRQVRLGISAPEGLPVYREELYQQILAEGEGEQGTEGKVPPLSRRARKRDDEAGEHGEHGEQGDQPEPSSDPDSE